MPRLKLSALEAHRKIFSDYINYRARECGMTVEHLAELCAISETTMHNYKRAPERIPTGKLAAMASALNIRPDVLLNVYIDGLRPWEQKEARA